MGGEDRVRRNGRGLALGAGIVVIAVLIFAVTGDPQLPHDSVLDVVFDTRWMVAGARLVVAVAGLYVLVSVGVRISRGQWARSAAGVSTDVQEIDRGAESLRDAAADAQEEIDELKDQLEKTTAALDDLGNLDRS